MAHPDVALDVQGRGPGEAERLHVGVDHGLVEGVGHAPCTLEPGHDLGVQWTPVVVNQLDLLVGAVVGIAVVDDDIETVWKKRSIYFL